MVGADRLLVEGGSVSLSRVGVFFHFCRAFFTSAGLTQSRRLMTSHLPGVAHS